MFSTIDHTDTRYGYR